MTFTQCKSKAMVFTHKHTELLYHACSFHLLVAFLFNVAAYAEAENDGKRAWNRKWACLKHSTCVFTWLLIIFVLIFFFTSYLLNNAQTTQCFFSLLLWIIIHFYFQCNILFKNGTWSIIIDFLFLLAPRSDAIIWKNVYFHLGQFWRI